MSKGRKSSSSDRIRPKMTPEVLSKIETALSLGATIDDACFYAGIHRTTFYVWLEQEPEFKERIDALRAKPVLLAYQTLIKGIKEDPKLALKFLERVRRKEFALRQEIVTPEDSPFTIRVIVDDFKKEENKNDFDNTQEKRNE